MRQSSSFSSGMLSVHILTACARNLEQVGGDVLLRDQVADVTMRSTAGEVVGTLRFRDGPNGAARLVGAMTGISAGKHGIHVHQVGRCDAPSFESAGAHFNPFGKQHGLGNPMGSHAGDAPNIEADATMRANVDVTFANATLGSAFNTLFDADGSAVVVHAAEDDQRTDPSGNSGARIACGVLAK
jgi:Cu-Zn family superoxide dismutase